MTTPHAPGRRGSGCRAPKFVSLHRVTVLVLYLLYAIALSVALGRAGLRGPAVAREPASRGSRPARVLIVGATGGTGRELVRRALERGYEVTALVRDPARMTVAHPRLSVVRGDVTQPESLDSPMRGQDAVLCALGHRRYYPPSRILSEGTRNIVRAMEAHGTRRLVCETSLGIGDSAGRMGLYYTLFVIPVILPFYYWDKTRQERIVARSGVEWIIVRPGALKNRPARGRVRHGRGVGGFLLTPRIARADVADFMLDQLESDAYLGAAPGITW